jgi:hypothetical protein
MQRGKLNILDLNVLSEDFYAYLLNYIYGWNLTNKNTTNHNIGGLDLIDDTQKIIVQVSSDVSKRKIELSLSKIDAVKYTGYNFKFFGITNDAKKLRENKYLNKNVIFFNPQTDILDITVILKCITNMEDIEKIEKIYKFLQKEIKMPISQEKIETNIAKIIEAISQIDLDDFHKPEIKPFDIEKKIIYNNLIKSRSIIDDYKQYYTIIDKIYTEFDKLGNNKSLSVLNNLKSIYIERSEIKNQDDCFQQIINDVINFVKQSSNYKPIPEEELLMYVGIIVVDAFIRCKIFKNPEAI